MSECKIQAHMSDKQKYNRKYDNNNIVCKSVAIGVVMRLNINTNNISYSTDTLNGKQRFNNLKEAIKEHKKKLDNTKEKKINENIKICKSKIYYSNKKIYTLTSNAEKYKKKYNKEYNNKYIKKKKILKYISEKINIKTGITVYIFHKDLFSKTFSTLEEAKEARKNFKKITPFDIERSKRKILTEEKRKIYTKQSATTKKQEKYIYSYRNNTTNNISYRTSVVINTVKHQKMFKTLKRAQNYLKKLLLLREEEKKTGKNKSRHQVISQYVFVEKNIHKMESLFLHKTRYQVTILIKKKEYKKRFKTLEEAQAFKKTMVLAQRVSKLQKENNNG